jgi:hypothetical protein
VGLTSSPRKTPLSPNPNKWEKEEEEEEEEEEKEEEKRNALCEGMNTYFLFSTRCR